MACNCKQGYVLPGMNKTPCGCQLGFSGGWPGLMGHTKQQWGLAGMLGGTTLAAGSHFRQGYSLHWPYSCGITTSGANPVPFYATDEVEGCLYNTGQFANVTASCSGGWVTGSQYLLVEGDTAGDFAQRSDLQGLITDTIKNCVTSLGFSAIASVDTLKIDAIPQALAGNSDYDQGDGGSGVPPQTPFGGAAAAGGAGAPPGGGGGQGNPPCPPGYYDASFFHGLLGYDCQPIGSGTSSLLTLGAGAGGGIAIAAVVMVGLLFVIAKR